MKTKKILLPGMVAALAFAACTNEEIVTMPNVTPEVDLSNRPLVGQVDLNLGGSQTRATLAEDRYYNSLDWGNDAVGARLIDEPNGGRNQWNPFVSYKGSDYAWTNYKYNKVEGADAWTTEALLVEGSYMFYAPYNEAARQRDPLKVTFPMKQTVNPQDAGVEGVEANTSAINGFYDNKEGHVFALGHAFISANDEVTKIEPTMTHLYAYPEITLKNDYTEYNEESKEDEGKSITIDKIVVSSSKIYGEYALNHTNFISNLTKGYDEVKVGSNVKAQKVLAGKWYKGINEGIKSFRGAATADIMTGSKAGNIEVDFEPNLTLEAGEEFPFHMVLPAAVYSDLKVQVILEGSKTFYSELEEEEVDYETMKQFAPAATVVTYAPSHRYPVEEWNFPTNGAASVKASAGDLATFSISGYIGDYTAPRLGLDFDGFMEYLRTLDNNTKDVVEGSQTFTLKRFTAEEGNAANNDDKYTDYSVVYLTQALQDSIKKYLVDGSVTFTSPMIAKGEFTSNGKIAAVGGLLQHDNAVINMGNTNIVGAATFKGEATVKNIVGAATFGGKATVNGKISGAATFNGQATVNADAEITGAATFNADGTVYGETAGANIVGGTVTLKKANNKNAPSLGEIKVYNNGTLKLESNANYAGQIVLGYDATDDNTANPTAGNLVVSTDQTAAKINLVKGSVENNNVLKLSSWAWTAGTLTNNKTIEGVTIDVPAGAKYVHGANAVATIGEVKCTKNDNDVVVAKGEVENSGDLTVATNNGLITAMGGNTYTTVGAGEGSINNSKLGVVDAPVDHTVYFNTGAFENDAAWEKIEAAKGNGINKLVVDGQWDVTEATTVPADYSVVEFQNNLIVTDVKLTFASTTEVVIGAASTWSGRVEASSIVDGMKSVTENAAWTLKRISLGGDYYANQLATGGTLRLTSDINFSSVKTINGVNLTIDLNGHKITALTEKNIVLKDNSTLTIKNGTIESAYNQLVRVEGKATLNVESTATLIAAGNTITAVSDDVTLNIKGKVYATDENYCAVITNGNYENVNVNVNGATIEANGGAGAVAMYIPSDGNVTITNSTLKGTDSAIEFRGEGKLTINGGSFEATADTYSATPNGSGTTIIAAAVAVSPHKDRDAEVEINNKPKFFGVVAFWEGQTVADTKGRTTVNEFLMAKESNGDIYLDGAKLSATDAAKYKATE